MNVVLRTIGRCLPALVVLGLGGWATTALLVAGSDAGTVRQVLACGLAVLTCAAAAGWLLARARLATAAVLAVAVAVAAALVWYHGLRASNDRTWPGDVAHTPWAEIAGDRVTFHEVRNFAWRTEADFTPAWETRTVAVSDLEGVDLIASYWMGDAIAHVMVSFDFGHAPPVLVSIEARKEVGEPYSTLLGFFRRYELVYVVADERDAIGVRTNVRANPPEDVYLYRVTAPKEAARRLFLEYVRQINRLHERPEFYNTATTNCTTMVLINNRVNGPTSLLNWKILLSGYLPQLVYERGRLDQALPFPELRRRSRVNDAARAAGLDAPDFSARIRAGLPVPAQQALATSVTPPHLSSRWGS
ncbi:MAG: DUF4105 domain-containing protein [Geminicoccaceae bacterium]